MEANSIAFLQQLASNPQLIDQLQSLLSIISPRPAQQAEAVTALSTSPKVSSPPVVTAASPDAAAGVSLRRYEELALRCRKLEDELGTRAREAAAASSRSAELEREAARLQRRLDEAAAAHDAELRRRDERHDEALRQLLAAQRMVNSAAAVAAPGSPALQLQSASRANDVSGAPASGVKRERPRSDTAASRPRRRTPRTPSLTAADRAAGAASQRRAGPETGASPGGPGQRSTAPFVPAASPAPATSTVTEAMARHRGGAQSRFVTQYANPVPAAAGPAVQATSASRTPRARGQRSGTSSIVAGPTRSPSPVNPKRGAEQPRRFVVTSLSEEERARVRQAVATLGQHGVVMDSDYEDPPPFTATHIIVRGAPRSMKALCGVVAAKWLVPPEYVYDSCSAGFWLDEYEEGGLRCFPPPLKCQRFLLSMPEGIVKEKLEQVIEYGGGEVLRSEKNGRKQSIDQGVVVITSGDELLRFATRVE